MSAAEGAVNRERALRNVGGDPELLGEIVDLFLDQCPRLMDSIRDGIESGDAGAVRQAAHTLKGSVLQFEARRTIELAFRLEEMGLKGDVTGAPETFRLLAEELERLEPELRSLAQG